MFIVYDQTWKRHLVYGRFTDGTGPVLLESASDGTEPISIFRTRKSAEIAIENTKNYPSEGMSLEWTKNIYVILPVKMETKQWNRKKRKK